LLGEHVEVHCMWNVITQNKRGYRNHPETKRWVDHLAALAARHDLLVAEMATRGYNHKSPLNGAEQLARGPVRYPSTIEPIETMREKLSQKILGN
jgi:hypothetical protein